MPSAFRAPRAPTAGSIELIPKSRSNTSLGPRDLVQDGFGDHEPVLGRPSAIGQGGEDAGSGGEGRNERVGIKDRPRHRGTTA